MEQQKSIMVLFIVIIALVNTMGTVTGREYKKGNIDKSIFTTINNLAISVMVSILIYTAYEYY